MFSTFITNENGKVSADRNITKGAVRQQMIDFTDAAQRVDSYEYKFVTKVDNIGGVTVVCITAKRRHAGTNAPYRPYEFMDIYTSETLELVA